MIFHWIYCADQLTLENYIVNTYYFLFVRLSKPKILPKRMLPVPEFFWKINKFWTPMWYAKRWKQDIQAFQFLCFWYTGCPRKNAPLREGQACLKGKFILVHLIYGIIGTESLIDQHQLSTILTRTGFLFVMNFEWRPIFFQVQEKYSGHEEEWRYELRVRYIPTDLKDLYEKDKVTFYYYYDQVSRDLPFKMLA